MTVVSSTGSDVGGLGTPSLVSGNILRSFNGWLGENGDASFRASFTTAVDSFSADFAGIATLSSTRIFAYNGTTLLTTVTASSTGQQRLTVAGVGLITSVVITPGDFFDWVGVDNITYNRVVPEPSTFALMGLGLAGIVGRAACRRKAA
ncbi:MAG: PEP-CTERM sorting domain-containing protein [Isosphaeraceae bacterium]